mmetsp:Transcript_88309/g.175539  ORF Transcript_88309/g.175539 Transcript_88309/m.175539 type:complete len:222 (-) Transcript_88309:801-1466(-)
MLHAGDERPQNLKAAWRHFRVAATMLRVEFVGYRGSCERHYVQPPLLGIKRQQRQTVQVAAPVHCGHVTHAWPLCVWRANAMLAGPQVRSAAWCLLRTVRLPTKRPHLRTRNCTGGSKQRRVHAKQLVCKLCEQRQRRCVLQQQLVRHVVQHEPQRQSMQLLISGRWNCKANLLVHVRGLTSLMVSDATIAWPLRNYAKSSMECTVSQKPHAAVVTSSSRN